MIELERFLDDWDRKTDETDGNLGCRWLEARSKAILGLVEREGVRVAKEVMETEEESLPTLPYGIRRLEAMNKRKRVEAIKSGRALKVRLKEEAREAKRLEKARKEGSR